jgi:hypothetical protein
MATSRMARAAVSQAGVNNRLPHLFKKLQDLNCISLSAEGNICDATECGTLVVKGLSCFNNGLIFNTTLDVLICDDTECGHANVTIKISDNTGNVNHSSLVCSATMSSSSNVCCKMSKIFGEDLCTDNYSFVVCTSIP